MAEAIKMPLTNAQIELLKIFDLDLSDEEFKVLKRLLLEFKFKRVSDLADKIWEEKGFTDEDMEKLLHTHLRTPYKSFREKQAHKK